jgi:site-specific DNA-methyltransferase (adenine-specific)
MDEVPVIYVSDLSDVQLKKYRILDNKLSDIAKRDIENLKIELEDINDEELGELFDVFSFSDIEEVSEDFSQKNKEIDPDSIYGDEKTHICPKCHFEFLPK